MGPGTYPAPRRCDDDDADDDDETLQWKVMMPLPLSLARVGCPLSAWRRSLVDEPPQVYALTNMTEVENKEMPFRCQRDGDAIIFRHSYWLGVVRGPHITIRHAKKLDVELHLTSQGFVFVGQDSYFQGAGGTCIPSLGRAGVVWVQGPRPARWIERARGRELLRRQRILSTQGDLNWLGIAKNARLEDPEEDTICGAEEEKNEVPLPFAKGSDKRFENNWKNADSDRYSVRKLMHDDIEDLVYNSGGNDQGDLISDEESWSLKGGSD